MGLQLRPGDARRWILVTREKGIAPSPGEAARWAVDHLIIDQDAVPTLAEVKRGSNPEARRTIVGQLLEVVSDHRHRVTVDQELLHTTAFGARRSNLRSTQSRSFGGTRHLTHPRPGTPALPQAPALGVVVERGVQRPRLEQIVTSPTPCLRRQLPALPEFRLPRRLTSG